MKHLLVFSFLLILVGCTTVPETGRSQLLLISNEQLASAAANQYGELKKELGLSNNQQMRQRLNRVGRDVVIAARERSPDAGLPPPEEWEFEVFKSEQVNAFAMPGGYIGFYEGIMTKFENDDQLAAVVAHEVAHVAAKHGGERVSQQLLVQGALVGGAIGLGYSEMDRNTQVAIIQGLGFGAQLGVLLPYSRTHENEADYMGIIYMAEAGYDPRAAVDFWLIMQSLGGQAPPEILSTHPSNETRIRKLTEQMPAALEIYERNR